MARPISVRGLTEGAILAALVAVLALAANYVPLVGLAANFLCPIPLAVLMIRHGLRVAALATVVAIAIGSAISGPVTGVLSCWVLRRSAWPLASVCAGSGRRRRSSWSRGRRCSEHSCLGGQRHTSLSACTHAS